MTPPGNTYAEWRAYYQKAYSYCGPFADPNNPGWVWLAPALDQLAQISSAKGWRIPG